MASASLFSFPNYNHIILQIYAFLMVDNSSYVAKHNHIVWRSGEQEALLQKIEQCYIRTALLYIKIVTYYGATIVLPFNVTAAIRASSRPSITAPVFTEID